MSEQTIAFLSDADLPEKVARRVVSKHDKLRKALIENPGQWALFGEYPKRETANQRAGSVRTGSGRWEKGLFEATVTARPKDEQGNVPTGFAVYVKFIGSPEQASAMTASDNTAGSTAETDADEFSAETGTEVATDETSTESTETNAEVATTRRGRKAS